MDGQAYGIPNLALGFQMTIKSRRDQLAEAADRIMSVVQTLPCAGDDLDDLHLALLEALSNAVIHGNREDPNKTVVISAGCDGKTQLLIAVTDQGDGFDPAALANPTAPENKLTGHGRGVFLMRHLVDEVEFSLGGRQALLRKRIATQRRTTDITNSALRTLD